MNIIRTLFDKQNREKYKILIMVILLGISFCITYYFYSVLHIDAVFTHFFYIPVILSALWWKRKGLLVAVFLATMLAFSNIFVSDYVTIGKDFFRAGFLIVVAILTVVLHERAVKARLSLVKSDEKVKHLNLVLRAIRKVNQLIVSQKDCDKLIQGICDNFIETRGYHNAWIALFDESGRFLRSAESGMGKKFMSIVNKLKRNEFTECCSRALSQPGVVIIEDPSSTCSDCPLAEEYGSRGAMIIRLEYDGKVYGILTVSVHREFIIDKEEQSLFEEVANDIAFALSNIEHEEKHKQAEKSLEESEMRYRSLFETAAEGILIADIKTKKFKYANPAISKMLGYSAEELTKMGVSDIHPQESLMHIIAEFEAQARGEKTLAPNLPCLRKDGKILYTNISTTKAMIDDMECNIGFFTDISELKHAEESLILFRSLVDQSNDTIEVIDVETGRFIDVNEKGCMDLGYSREEILSLSASDIDPIVDQSMFIKLLEELRKSGSILMESIHRRKDGSTFPVEVNIKYVHHEQDYLITVARDITGRKQAEEQMKGYSENLEKMVEERTRELNRALWDTEASRAKIDGILKSVSDGLIVTDKYNRIILMNRAAEDLLRVRFSEVIDRPIEFAVEEKSLREKLVDTYNKMKTNYTFDFQLPGDDPQYPRFMRARTSVIHDSEGKYTGIVTIFHDVTHELEVDRMKTEFLSTAAHELRTPLTSIMGFSEILQTREDISEEEKKKFLSYINKQAVNLAEIINDLLDISQIESGRKYTINKEICDVGKTIKSIIPYFQEIYVKHKFEVVLPDKPVKCYVDKEKMEQVLKNLLSNAVKYSPEGGVIRVVGEVFEDYYQMSIEDQGIGMTPEQIEKIFDKFYRADATDTAISGTGLGMSIVKYLVEAHGGKVVVESELGKGTTVRFTILLDHKKKQKNEEKSKNS